MKEKIEIKIKTFENKEFNLKFELREKNLSGFIPANGLKIWKNNIISSTDTKTDPNELIVYLYMVLELVFNMSSEYLKFLSFVKISVDDINYQISIEDKKALVGYSTDEIVQELVEMPDYSTYNNTIGKISYNVLELSALIKYRKINVQDIHLKKLDFDLLTDIASEINQDYTQLKLVELTYVRKLLETVKKIKIFDIKTTKGLDDFKNQPNFREIVESTRELSRHLRFYSSLPRDECFWDKLLPYLGYANLNQGILFCPNLTKNIPLIDYDSRCIIEQYLNNVALIYT